MSKMEQQTIIEMVLGGFITIIGYFLKSTHSDLKSVQKELNEHQEHHTDKHDKLVGKVYQMRNDSVQLIDKLQSKMDLIEMDLKRDVEALKQMNSIQFKSIHDDMTEMKTQMSEISKSIGASNSMLGSLVENITRNQGGK